MFLKKWAATRDFQECGILRGVDSDGPVRPSVELRNFKWYSSVARQSWSNQETSKGSDQTVRMRRLVWAFAGRTYLIVGNLMSRLKYVRHCLCNALYVYCRGRAVTNVGKTCGPTPCFVLAINTFKLSGSVVECLTRDQEAAGSSLTGVTALWSLSKTHLS